MSWAWGSSVKDVRKKGWGRSSWMQTKVDKGGFQHKRTSAYLSHVDLEEWRQSHLCISLQAGALAASRVCLAGTPTRRQCGQSIAVAGAATARHNVSTASAAVVPPVSPHPTMLTNIRLYWHLTRHAAMTAGYHWAVAVCSAGGWGPPLLLTDASCLHGYMTCNAVVHHRSHCHHYNCCCCCIRFSRWTCATSCIVTSVMRM